MNKRTIIASFIVLASLGRSQTSPATAIQTSKPRGNLSKRFVERERRNAEFNALLNSAAKAADSGQYAGAESLYRKAFEASGHPESPFHRIYLARLHDRMGRDREAFGDYRVVLEGVPGGYASEASDPVVLARYGDLCIRFATLDEAARAYRKAAANSNRDDVLDPSTEGWGESLTALRAAAHTAAGVELYYSGHDAEALLEYDAALRADPDFWVALYYRAIQRKGAGRMGDATRDAARAEALATPKGPGQARRMRYGSQIPDLAGNYIPPQPVPGFRPHAHPPSPEESSRNPAEKNRTTP